VVTIEDINNVVIGTFEGSQQASHVITPMAGKLVDVQDGGFMLHGTGEFEGLMLKGTYVGYNDVYPPSLLIELEMEGILLSPK
jgi:hypothetical protein